MTQSTSDDDAAAARRRVGDERSVPVGGAPDGSVTSRNRWSRAAAAVCLVHAALLLGLAGFYALELARGEGSSTTNVVLSLALILVFALFLGLLARIWWVGSGRAVVPTVIWNGLLIPVVIALYGADDRLVATGLLVLVVAGIVTAVAATRRSRPAVGTAS